MSTNFPNGLESMGVPVIGAQGFMTSGTSYFVDPKFGSNSNSGKDIKHPLKDVNTAYTRAADGKGDVIYLLSNGETASADVSSYQTSQLVWAKDRLHLIGLAAPTEFSPRARIAAQTSTTDVFAPVLQITGQGSYFANFQVWMGVESNTNVTGAVEVTGERNKFSGVHIAGIGHADNDVAGAYSLKLNGGGENLFERCVIGIDTIARGTAANSEILIDGGVTRTVFRGCKVVSMIEHATNHPQVKLADATAIDRLLEFDDCLFYNMSTNYATTQSGIFKLVADLTQGYIIVRNSVGMSASSSATKWDVDDRNKIYLFNSPTPAADTAGLTRNV